MSRDENDDTRVEEISMPRTVTGNDVTDERLMIGLLRQLRQDMSADRDVQRERHQRLLERIDQFSIDLETHFENQKKLERRIAAMEPGRRAMGKK